MMMMTIIAMFWKKQSNSWVIIAMMALFSGVMGFLPHQHSSLSFIHPRNTRSLRLREGDNIRWMSSSESSSSLLSSSSPDDLLGILSTPYNPSSSYKTTELWLDLRGTAISPRAAIAYLMEEWSAEEDTTSGDDEDDDDDDDDDLSSATSANDNSNNNNKCFIDKVLVSDTMFQRMLEEEEREQDQHLLLRKGFVSSLLYIPDDSKDLLVESRNGVSVPIGIVMTLPKDPSTTTVVEDPIPAMDAIARGQWVVLSDKNEDDSLSDSANEDEGMARVAAVSSFIDIIAASTSSPLLTGIGSSFATALDSSSGLLLPMTKEEEEDIDGQNDDGGETLFKKLGGIALSCSSKSFVVQAASLLRASMAMSMTTESGILIHQADNSSNNKSSSGPPPMKTALLLPFDIMLWRTALMLYGEQQEF